MVIFLLTRNTQIMHAELNAYATPFSAPLRSAGDLWSLSTLPGAAALNAEITRQATLVAFLDDFRLMMVLALAVMPLVALMRRPGRAASAAPAVME